MSEFNTYRLSVRELFELSRVLIVISWHVLSPEKALNKDDGFNAARSSRIPGTNPFPMIFPSGMLFT